MAISGGAFGFNNPHLRAWLRQRAAERLQATVEECLRRAESEQAVERYRVVAMDCLARASKKTRRRSH